MRSKLKKILSDPKFQEKMKKARASDYLDEMREFPLKLKMHFISKHATNEQIRSVYNVFVEMDEHESIRLLKNHLKRNHRKIILSPQG